MLEGPFTIVCKVVAWSVLVQTVLGVNIGHIIHIDLAQNISLNACILVGPSVTHCP